MITRNVHHVKFDNRLPSCTWVCRRLIFIHVHGIYLYLCLRTPVCGIASISFSSQHLKSSVNFSLHPEPLFKVNSWLPTSLDDFITATCANLYLPCQINKKEKDALRARLRRQRKKAPPVRWPCTRQDLDLVARASLELKQSCLSTTSCLCQKEPRQTASGARLVGVRLNGMA